MKNWKNWSGNITTSPTSFASPTTENEIPQIISSAKNIRSVGAGHSFTPLCATNETLIDINGLSGYIGEKENIVEFWAGTTINEVGRLSHDHGFALPCQGDIDSQTLAGAFNTATHSSNGSHPCMSSFSTSMTLFDGRGEKHTIAHGTEEYFGATVGLGMFGVVSRYELKLDPAEPYLRHEFQVPIEQIINEYEELRADFNTCEFFYFPGSHFATVGTTRPLNNETIGIKQANIATAKNIGLQTSKVIDTFATISKYLPFTTPYLTRYMSKALSPIKIAGPPHIVNANYRYSKFNEMEYAIPIENGTKCLREIIDLMETKRLHSVFPLQVRFVKGDDFWMSPFYQQDCLTIAVHQAAIQSYDALFKACEEIFLQFNGRPHWGKVHTIKRPKIKKIYPKFTEFIKLRKEFDPQNKFLNPYLQAMFL